MTRTAMLNNNLPNNLLKLNKIDKIAIPIAPSIHGNVASPLVFRIGAVSGELVAIQNRSRQRRGHFRLWQYNSTCCYPEQELPLELVLVF
jgi:hypothetical protein